MIVKKMIVITGVAIRLCINIFLEIRWTKSCFYLICTVVTLFKVDSTCIFDSDTGGLM